MVKIWYLAVKGEVLFKMLSDCYRHSLKPGELDE
jgi:hypothetical protein